MKFQNPFSGKSKKNTNLSSTEFAHWVVNINYFSPNSNIITFAILWTNSADNKFVNFFLFFPENWIWHFMQIVLIGDNLHGMSNPIFPGKKKKNFFFKIPEC